MAKKLDFALPEPGARLLGKYRIDRVLGQGGAGVVFAAHHELLDQPIALKVLIAEVGSETATRFLNEAKLAARIHGDHVCRVMDVGELESGLPYIAMEYLDGRDLDSVIEEGAVPLARACDYVMQALEAVAQAHAQGIVHRDLKPSNLFLAKVPTKDAPIVKVLDFGISKGDMLGVDKDVTSSRSILGSPSYMSPEQIKNARTVDARSDIWSLGVILFELTSGKPPFPGETVGEVFAKILDGEHRPLRDVAPHLPDAFGEVINKCLRLERDERYASVADLADAIAPFAADASAELTTIHGLRSPVASLSVKATQAAAPMSMQHANKALAAPSSTAHGVETPEPQQRKGRGLTWLALAAAFTTGGLSVWYLGGGANLPSPTQALASANALATALADGGTILLPAGNVLDLDATAAEHETGVADAALQEVDSGDAGPIGDAGADADDDAGEDDDDDEVSDAATATVRPAGGGPARPRPNPHAPKKTKGTKRKRK